MARFLFFGCLATSLALAQTSPDIRALELYRAGNCKEAKPLLEDILRRQPRNATIRKMLANCLAKDNRKEEAKGQYQQVLKITPWDPNARRALQPPPPPAPVKPAPALSPEAAERLRAGAEFEEAERHIIANRLPQAEKLLLAVVLRHPDLILPRQRLAELYTRTKQFDDAAKSYEILTARPGASPVFLLRLAQNLTWAERYTDAIRSYRLFLDQNPADADARQGLSNVLLWSNSLDEAVVSFRAYLKLREEDLDARVSLGNALLWSKHFDEATAEFRRVQQKRPQDPAVALSLAQSLEQGRKFEDAVKAYDTVLALAPGNTIAIEGKDRILSGRPQAEAFSRLEAKDFDGAASSFRQFLDRNPQSTETLLQIARVYAWGRRYNESARYYQQYLAAAPKDLIALRELGKIQITIPDFPAARATYARLAAIPDATVEDLEGVVQAHIWDGKAEEAQPFARQLVARDSTNKIAGEAIRAFQDKARFAQLDRAQRLSAAARYSEAYEAYRAYSRQFGASREIELNMARVLGYDNQRQKSIAAYEEYLQRYPGDSAAALELGDLRRWSGDYDGARKSYQEVAAKDAANPKALLGLAQVADSSGENRFQVVKAYQQVAELEPANGEVAKRLEVLAPAVSPSLNYFQRAFTDSDGFGRSSNYFETSIPLTGGLRLTPFYRYDYLSHLRQVGGTRCGAANPESDQRISALNQRICGNDGIASGQGGGLRFELSPARMIHFSAELSALRFDRANRTSTQGMAELQIRPGQDRIFSISAARRDAVYDVNTLSTLYAGIVSDSLTASYQQPLTDKWRLYVSGGGGRFSRGTGGETPSNTLRRFSARLDYQVNPNLNAGYFTRVSSFTQGSRLYFSPSYYGVYGFSYSYSKPLFNESLRIGLEAEAGFGQINRFDIPTVNVFELVAYPAFSWMVRPDLSLQFGYRFGRGRSSSFGSPVYNSGAFEFSLSSYFLDRRNRRSVDPLRQK